MSESFTYDNLNRLYTYQVSGQTSYSAIYSNNGNITSKTDAGSYTYDATKLNAVASVTNPSGIIPTNSQTIDYTGFNKAFKITDGTYVQDITYGPDNQRIKSVLKNNGTVIKTKYYAPGYEKEIKSGVTRELHYVSCPYGLVAVLIKQGGTTTTYYTETDHLGSITGLMDANGTYAEQFSYDPYGRRRNPTNWTYTAVPQPLLIDRGFTGHEHYDNFGLIDMNGRMYDPILGRFLGVDPLIQDAGNSQSINGYGYALNNPLKYIDPSGYSYQRFMEIFAEEQRDNKPAEFFNIYPKGWEQFQNTLSKGEWQYYLSGAYIMQGSNPQFGRKGTEVGYWVKTSNYILNPNEGNIHALNNPGSVGITLEFISIPSAQSKGDNDIKPEFIQRVSQMEATFGAVGNTFNDLYGGKILSYPAKLAVFGYLQYKGARTEFMNPKAFSGSDFYRGGFVNGQFYTADDFGNYFYGVAARAMGITLLDAVQGAGIYAILTGSLTDWTNFYGFFDERKDTQTIMRGYYGY